MGKQQHLHPPKTYMVGRGGGVHRGGGGPGQVASTGCGHAAGVLGPILAPVEGGQGLCGKKRVRQARRWLSYAPEDLVGCGV